MKLITAKEAYDRLNGKLNAHLLDEIAERINDAIARNEMVILVKSLCG